MSGEEAAFGHGAENGHCCGCTKRELFAAMAMQGILANSVAWQEADHMEDSPADAVALWAVGQADALLAALAEKK